MKIINDMFMKKFYLFMLSCLFIGGLAAQSVTSKSSTLEKKKLTSRNDSFSQSTVTNEESSITKDLPGFPEFVDTGNREKDCATFNTAMETWMNTGDNKKLYDNYLIKLGRREATTEELKKEESK